MDSSDILRTIAELSARAVRADRDQQRRNHDHRSTREALRQTTADLEEVVKLADVLYDTSQRMGAVIDYLLRERGANDQRPDSFEWMLNHILRELEDQEAGSRQQGDRHSQGPEHSDKVARSSAPSEAVEGH